MAENTPVTPHRIERLLGAWVGTLIGLAVLSIVALLIAKIAHVAITGQIWTVVALVPFIALPIGFILIIVRLVVGSVRRAREARDA